MEHSSGPGGPARGGRRYRSGRRDRRRALGVLVALTTAALVAATPIASAAPTATPPRPAPAAPASPAAPAAAPASTTPPAGPPAHPQDDRMGSTIRQNEATPFATATPRAAAGQPYGMDVASYQGNVDWGRAYANGARFAYVKASESTTYLNPYFGQQYNGSAAAGMIRGAYHFALPNLSSGATQATYFVNHGGGWTGDGRTLPPMLDIEYNPYGPTCYGLSTGQMSAWIADFSNTVRRLTGRYPTIYSTANWWNTCTGYNGGFGANPLFIARYASSPGTLPPGWANWTFWQFSDSGTFPGDQDLFNGSMDQLRALAGNGNVTPYGAIGAYWTSKGGANGFLGQPLNAEYAVTGGRAQDFAGATVYWSPATGAHAVGGTIRIRYQGLGATASGLGFPTSDELVASDQRGRYQTFANAGSLFWNPAVNAAFAVTGAARDKYVALGGPAGFLGYPRVDTTVCPDGVGTYTHFLGGGSIYTSPATGAHEVHGAIYARWAQMGWERSSLGYPTTDEQAVTGGRRSTFQRGTITWNATTGAVTVP